MTTHTTMSFDEDGLLPPPAASAVCCSDDCYRQCSPESCPGLTAQCTERCVVVTCLDSHDDDNQEVCGDIICDDQSCTDTTDYDLLQCCDNYHDYPREPKYHILDHHNTASTFDSGGWDFDALLGQGFQHGHEHHPVGYYNGVASSPLTSTSDTVTAMTVSSSRSSSPSTSSTGHSRHHSYTHPSVYQPNHHQHQHIANPSPPFHDLTRPGEGLTFEPNSPRSHDLSQIQSQGHLVLGQAEVPERHPCMWDNCHTVFGSLQDLVAHVNVQHLQTVSASLTANNQPDPIQDPASTHHQSTLNSAGQIFPSCHWGDCHVYPTVEDVPSSSDRPLDAALGVLAAHLWEYHLGLPTPPPQFNFPSATTSAVAQTADGFVHSPSLGNGIARVQTSSVEVEMMDMAAPAIPAPSVAAEADAVSDAITSPHLYSGSTPDHTSTLTLDQDHAQDRGHDCATTDHPCKWLDCQERFVSCEALMAHVTAEHVGGGKNHYGCFWDGCGRNGENGFKSKQKICRHLQSHTGHRPHQCEVCQQCFSEVATLQQHMRRHTQEKPYECDHPGCGKRFAIMGALTIHKRMHNGDKPFKCPRCDKAFSESSNLSKHLRTHTGVRPYVCPEPGCGKCFGRGDQLTRHMNVHSGGGKVGKRMTAATTKVD